MKLQLFLRESRRRRRRWADLVCYFSASFMWQQAGQVFAQPKKPMNFNRRSVFEWWNTNYCICDISVFWRWFHSGHRLLYDHHCLHGRRHCATAGLQSENRPHRRFAENDLGLDELWNNSPMSMCIDDHGWPIFVQGECPGSIPRKNQIYPRWDNALDRSICLHCNFLVPWSVSPFSKWTKNKDERCCCCCCCCCRCRCRPLKCLTVGSWKVHKIEEGRVVSSSRASIWSI